MGFLKSNDGIKCEPTEEGLRCHVYKKDGNEKLATGTDVTMAVDPQTCKAHFMGAFDISDGDEEKIKKIKDQLETQCRRGLA